MLPLLKTTLTLRSVQPYKIGSQLILLLLVALFHPVALAEDQPLVQQIITQHEKGESSYLYYYNRGGQKTLEMESINPNGSGWVNSTSLEWLYDDDGRCIRQLSKKWNGNAWQLEQQLDYNYQESRLFELIETAFGINNQPGEIAKTTYAYNQEGLLLSEHYAMQTNGGWRTLQIKTYSYLNGELECVGMEGTAGIYRVLVSTLSDGASKRHILQEKKGEGWENSTKYTTYKDANALVTSQELQHWERTDRGMDWVNSQNMYYAYNTDNRLTSEIYQQWSSLFWKNDISYWYTYNRENQILARRLAMPLHRTCRNIFTHHYDYQATPSKSEVVKAEYDYWGGNADDLLVSPLQYVFNADNRLASKTGNRIEIRYRQIAPTAINTPRSGEVGVYPNPSNGIFYVDPREHQVRSWSVVSLAGDVLHRHDNSHLTGMIDITHCPNGIYLLYAETPQGTITQKLIKQ